MRAEHGTGGGAKRQNLDACLPAETAREALVLLVREDRDEAKHVQPNLRGCLDAKVGAEMQPWGEVAARNSRRITQRNAFLEERSDADVNLGDGASETFNLCIDLVDALVDLLVLDLAFRSLVLDGSRVLGDHLGVIVQQVAMSLENAVGLLERLCSRFGLTLRVGCVLAGSFGVLGRGVGLGLDLLERLWVDSQLLALDLLGLGLGIGRSGIARQTRSLGFVSLGLGRRRLLASRAALRELVEAVFLRLVDDFANAVAVLVEEVEPFLGQELAGRAVDRAVRVLLARVHLLHEELDRALVGRAAVEGLENGRRRRHEVAAVTVLIDAIVPDLLRARMDAGVLVVAVVVLVGLVVRAVAVAVLVGLTSLGDLGLLRVRRHREHRNGRDRGKHEVLHGNLLEACASVGVLGSGNVPLPVRHPDMGLTMVPWVWKDPYPWSCKKNEIASFS